MERDIFASPVEPLFNHDYALEKEILQDWLINLAKKNARNINESHPQQVRSQFIVYVLTYSMSYFKDVLH